jgi:glycosyltransferase involved in cell wall biosynthesis
MRYNHSDALSNAPVTLARPSPPRRIVHVAARYPPALGGLEQTVQALARHQHKLGTDVQVLTSDQGTRGAFCQDEDFSVTRLRSIEIAHTAIIPGLLPSLSRLGRDALIHLHIAPAYAPEMVWLNKRLTHVAYVAHVHLDVLPSGRAGVLLEPYKRLILRRILHDAEAVLVPTDDYAALISAKYEIPGERIRVIRNGTDHDIMSQPRSAPRVGARDCQLLFVGRLSPQKNIPLLLEAIAAYLRRYGGGVRLTIVGEGETRDEISTQITRLGLGGIVTLRGPLYERQLQSVYEESDLLLLTSINESFGIVLIEAMTKGLPIVSVDILGVRNVMASGVNGILSEPTPDAVADAVHTLLANPDLYAAVSMNNLDRARGFRWGSIAEDMDTIYSSL